MTTGVAAVRDVVALVRGNPDECNHTGGLGEEDLARAERELATTFPPSYRYFLRELGSCEAGGVEFLGIYRTPARGDQLLGTVSATLDARADDRFPPDLLVVEYDGMGGVICLDSSHEGEYPVVVWDPGAAARGGPERLAGDFGAYALRKVRGALAPPPSR